MGDNPNGLLCFLSKLKREAIVPKCYSGLQLLLRRLLRRLTTVPFCATLIGNFAHQRKLKDSFGIGSQSGNERRCPLRQAIKARTKVSEPLLYGLPENLERDSNLVGGRDL